MWTSSSRSLTVKSVAALPRLKELRQQVVAVAKAHRHLHQLRKQMVPHPSRRAQSAISTTFLIHSLQMTCSISRHRERRPSLLQQMLRPSPNPRWRSQGQMQNPHHHQMLPPHRQLQRCQQQQQQQQKQQQQQQQQQQQCQWRRHLWHLRLLRHLRHLRQKKLRQHPPCKLRQQMVSPVRARPKEGEGQRRARAKIARGVRSPRQWRRPPQSRRRRRRRLRSHRAMLLRPGCELRWHDFTSGEVLARSSGTSSASPVAMRATAWSSCGQRWEASTHCQRPLRSRGWPGHWTPGRLCNGRRGMSLPVRSGRWTVWSPRRQRRGPLGPLMPFAATRSRPVWPSLGRHWKLATWRLLALWLSDMAAPRPRSAPGSGTCCLAGRAAWRAQGRARSTAGTDAAPTGSSRPGCRQTAAMRPPAPPPVRAAAANRQRPCVRRSRPMPGLPGEGSHSSSGRM
mmetsp:Transcript_27646/g.73433  ORF Transcript_27646/g.73433 Transcript_27646/m.73433 type:complete len:454 (-) Transcript_27646:1525-2886(-)